MAGQTKFKTYVCVITKFPSSLPPYLSALQVVSVLIRNFFGWEFETSILGFHFHLEVFLHFLSPLPLSQGSCLPVHISIISLRLNCLLEFNCCRVGDVVHFLLIYISYFLYELEPVLTSILIQTLKLT